MSPIDGSETLLIRLDERLKNIGEDVIDIKSSVKSLCDFQSRTEERLIAGTRRFEEHAKRIKDIEEMKPISIGGVLRMFGVIQTVLVIAFIIIDRIILK